MTRYWVQSLFDYKPMDIPIKPVLELSTYGPSDYSEGRDDISTMDPAVYWEIMEEYGALEEGD